MTSLLTILSIGLISSYAVLNIWLPIEFAWLIVVLVWLTVLIIIYSGDVGPSPLRRRVKELRKLLIFDSTLYGYDVTLSAEENKRLLQQRPSLPERANNLGKALKWYALIFILFAIVTLIFLIWSTVIGQ